MRLLVFGDRNWLDVRAIKREIAWRTPDVVIEGEAPGADSCAAFAADQLGILVERYPADWKQYGRGAGPIRNQQMLDEGKPDEAIGFHPDIANSKGSADMLRRCEKAGIPVRIYTK